MFARVIGALLVGGMAAHSAVAGTVAYQWTEGGPGNGVNSSHVSHHTSGGPVLADDFIPVIGGVVESVEWWGSAPLSVSGNDLWEITFHADGVAGTNAPALSILSQHLPVFAGGADSDGDGVFHFTASWTPQDLTLVAGTSYWFSVANGNPGWTWANAGGVAPTVGSEQYDAVVSAGAPGSPHFGPWASIANQDFAFQINVVPVPAAAWMGLPLLAGLAAARKFRGRRCAA